MINCKQDYVIVFENKVGFLAKLLRAMGLYYKCINVAVMLVLDALKSIIYINTIHLILMSGQAA